MIGEEQKNQCLKILDELVSHPISTVFQEPVDPVLDEVPDYLDVIQHPSDLSTVRNRLLRNKYATLADFKREVNLIWENAATYNGKNSLPWYIADHLSKIFSRRFALLEEPPVEQWVNEYLKARSVMCKLFHNAPKGLATYQIPADPVLQEEQRVPTVHEVSEDDLKFFQDNAEMFKDQAVFDKLVQILKANEPEMNVGDKESFKIDLSKLAVRTINLMKDLIMNEKEQEDNE